MSLTPTLRTLTLAAAAALVLGGPAARADAAYDDGAVAAEPVGVSGHLPWLIPPLGLALLVVLRRTNPTRRAPASRAPS